MLNRTQGNERTGDHIRVLIYGGGAVGLGVASCLLHSGNEVDVLARPQTVAALEAEGLTRTGIFGDVPSSDVFAPWIEQAYADGITVGCSADPLLYCPKDKVTRAQIAVFLVRVLGIPYLP